MSNQINRNYFYGDKVYLREMTLEDMPYILKWRNDPDIKKWMFIQNDITIEEHLKWFKTRKDRLDYIICDKSNDKPIGTVNFSNIQSKKPEAGKMLGDKSYWGGGYAKDAFSLWLAFGFNKLLFEKIMIKTMANNHANIFLNEKLGFRKIKSVKINISNDNIVDVVLMEKTNKHE
ncbi:GNAT family N-acetyltransferase [Psychroflexus sp. MES1-P1E]|uniref:GNAT family N-acetyltransferase n=1 Tax=Psychroflexus sp. MES1-P1E TaxID=2058320 RepID=UPI000C7BEC5F|nr:GNAT family N-acetyltransferase [Psychroflexus sp. MES1-P1E]PKG43443.1 hypothetical protein CXF67_05095 [Psychroflexus sp. MES1-P1E]